MPSLAPTTNKALILGSLVLSMSPTVTVSIPAGIIPICSPESPASKISPYSLMVTLSSPRSETMFSISSPISSKHLICSWELSISPSASAFSAFSPRRSASSSFSSIEYMSKVISLTEWVPFLYFL